MYLPLPENFTTYSNSYCFNFKMVSLKAVKASNARLSATQSTFVAIFVGGTSGIGKSTIEALVSTGADTRIYLVGRKSSKDRMNTFIKDMNNISPRAEVIWTEAEVSLLAETSRVCEDIKKKEKYVDLLFMSAGYAPFSGRKDTAEGLDVTQSLEYYSRLLFTLLLLPHLARSGAPRVVSVLAGGLEPASIQVDDLGLKKEANFGGFKSQGHYAAMNTMALEKLAEEHPTVTFVHSFPGWVNTGNHRRGTDPSSTLGRFVWPIFGPLMSLLSMSDEESGQRHLFESTSSMFGGGGVQWDGEFGLNTREKRKNGLFLLNQKCECTPNAKVLSSLREQAQKKVWAHTAEVLE